MRVLPRLGFDRVFAITGPLYLPSEEGSTTATKVVQYPVIESPDGPVIHVPTHFFKVLLVEKMAEGRSSNGSGEESKAVVDGKDGSSGSSFLVACFVIPNRKIAPDTPLVCVPSLLFSFSSFSLNKY